MKYIMPVMFTAMMLWLPSGLNLYIFVNTVLTMLPVSYTHLRAHETVLDLVCRLLLEKKNNTTVTDHIQNIRD